MPVLETGLRAAVAALAFLTRIPVGRWVALDGGDVARGAVLFPVVGAGIGAVVGLVVIGLDARLTALLAAGIAVAVEALLTGAIHLDAVADGADGLGAPDGERALEIMREPTMGAFGATALVLVLVVKVAALAAVVAGPDALLTIAAAYALGRSAPLVLGWALPAAAAGSGAALAGRTGELSRALGVGLGVGVPMAMLGARGLALLGGVIVASAVVGFLAWRRLGGVTGDVLGAATELATVLALVAAVATR